MSMSRTLSTDPDSARAPKAPPVVSRSHRPSGGTEIAHHRIVILGAGFAGLGMAIRLLQSGEKDFIVLDRGKEVGGTWRDNTYPGCQCDVPSNLYSFSFAPNPSWGRAFAPQAEILDYLKGCADRFGVRPHLRLETELLSARWDEENRLWRIETSRGPLTADILVSGHGGLSAPSMPEVPGLSDFRGTVFHSASWRHDHRLDGERVAVIGTGASAIQIVPAIQPIVKQLVLFQRTPPWILPRLDGEVSGLRKWWYRFLPIAQLLARLRQYLLREILVLAMNGRFGIGKLLERAAAAQLKAQVPDPTLRERLTPRYSLGCKRILISNNYYPALSQPNVEVASAVRSVTERGVVSDHGTEHVVDTIVLCTGFKVTDHPISGLLSGRDGRTLAEHWKDGSFAYLGTTVPSFPNLFLITGPNTGLGHSSMILMMEAQFSYVLGALRAMRASHAATLEVRREATEEFRREMHELTGATVWNSGCTSWYLDSQGRNTSVWPTFTWRFQRRTRAFDIAAYVTREAPAVPKVEREVERAVA